ncbi:transposase family protein, partial [Streptococcus sobrinus]|uniref:transposase family protein n=1 Tax=Streptococcus sobrinus TaxID=1310 RepID=UPI0004925046
MKEKVTSDLCASPYVFAVCVQISLVFETDTHIEIHAKLDYPAPPCPHCQGKMIKYDFQKSSKIPLLEQSGTPTLLRLKKRRFQCENC